MNIEYILREYPHIPEKIQKLNNELNNIIQCSDLTYNTLKAQRLTGMPHSTDTSDQVYDAVEKIIDRYDARINNIKNKINMWLDIQEKVDEIFYKPELLTIEERRIIELRYFHQFPWYRIPSVMRYSRRQCERFQHQALYKLNNEYIKLAENGGKNMVL